MKCYSCNKEFYRKRSFLTLFDTKQYYICDGCYQKNPIDIKLENINIGHRNVVFVSLFENKFKIKLDGYFREFNKIFSFFYEKYKEYEILFFDYVSLSIFNMEILDFYCECFEKPLLIICSVLRK